MMTDDEAQLQASTRAREGKLVEAGWIMTVLKGVPDDLPEAELVVLRSTFFTGAQHMLAVMAGAERRNDIDTQKLVDDLRAELGQFRKELGRKTAN